MPLDSAGKVGIGDGDGRDVLESPENSSACRYVTHSPITSVRNGLPPFIAYSPY